MAVKFNQEEVKQLTDILTNTPDVIKTQYVLPCKTTLKDCGLEADLQRGIDEAADELENNFNHDLSQFEIIRDNLLSFSADLTAAYEASQAKLKALKEATGNTTKVQTETRTRKMAF